MGAYGYLPVGSAEVPKGATAQESGIQQVWAGLLCRGWALSLVAGAPSTSRRARPEHWPLPGGPANDPVHSGLHGENWLRAGPLAGILPMLTHHRGGGRSEKLQKS